MSVSTSINSTGHTFVNDAQRQMITNAQQAVQNYQMPQPSENALLMEDDATVNEALSMFAGNDSQLQSQQQQPQQTFNANPQSMTQMPATGAAPMPMPMPMPMQQQQFQEFHPEPYMHVHEPVSKAHYLMYILDKDFKYAILMAILYVIVSFTPVHTMIGQYIAIDRIPFATIVTKAMLMSVLAYLVFKMA